MTYKKQHTEETTKPDNKPRHDSIRNTNTAKAKKPNNPSTMIYNAPMNSQPTPTIKQQNQPSLDNPHNPIFLLQHIHMK